MMHLVLAASKIKYFVFHAAAHVRICIMFWVLWPGQTNRWMDAHMDAWMDACMDIWANGWMDE